MVLKIVGKKHISVRPASSSSIIAWTIIIVSCFFLLGSSESSQERNAPLHGVKSERRKDESELSYYEAPERRHFHSALYRQGIAHEEFHLRSMKERLVGLVRYHNHVGIVGVEGGHDVIHLAEAGYKVDAFEPMSKYITNLERWLNREHITGVNLHHCAAGNITGGYMVAQYNTEKVRDSEKVLRKRVDDILPPGTGLDVLSVDIQGSEWDVIQGASRIVRGDGDIRSMWIEIHPCNPKVPPMLKQLDEWGYALFDMVPFGSPKERSERLSAFDTGMALDMGWHHRPSGFTEYFRWMCVMRESWQWLQTDVLAIQRQLVTPQLVLKLSKLSTDVLTSKQIPAV